MSETKRCLEKIAEFYSTEHEERNTTIRRTRMKHFILSILIFFGLLFGGSYIAHVISSGWYEAPLAITWFISMTVVGLYIAFGIEKVTNKGEEK